MPLFHISLLSILFVSLAVAADEGSWWGSLQDGSRITIDPSTNKATRTFHGETTPLWNGVHQLNNGAVIIVRDGVVVPDESLIQAQQEQARSDLHEACLKLVTKVCGPHSECQSHPSCDPARQLLAMERDELNSSWSGDTPESSMLCLEALGNEEFFNICDRVDKDRATTACERVAARVCGNGGACERREGCRAARQMVTLERQDRFDSPGTLSPATTQCREVLRQPAEFFQACER